MTSKKETRSEIKTAAPVYTKEQLLKSRKYEKRKDLLNVLLETGMNYTTAEVDKRIETFMKGKVN